MMDDVDSNVSLKSGANCSKCSGTTNAAGSDSSASSVFSEGGAGLPKIDPNRQNAYRSLIIDGVLENARENLAAICLNFVREMGIQIDPDDTEVAFRLGRHDPTKRRPRPVKLVLKHEIIRDQIFHFKLRLRMSKIFNSFQISLEKEMRVKLGILKRAATNARAQGSEFFSSVYRIKIDGVEYDTEHVKDIPGIFLDDAERHISGSVPEPLLNIRRLTVYARARKTSEKAIEVGTGLQKTPWGLLFFSAGCFLSNFFRCSVNYQGHSFKSVEQGYQAIMAKTCQQPEIFASIMATNSAALAKLKTKRMKRTQVWENMKLDVMLELLLCKFRQNKGLFFKLINTRPHPLYECTLDEYWGTGCRLMSISSVEGELCGENHLGILLMRVRDILISEVEDTQMVTN